ncbi:MAG: SulP family inorganic anion transporter [Alphaproteobacteria bacterium]|nr:SulP family inorganic anion transporter [Alphaproteobacteria bacterium]
MKFFDFSNLRGDILGGITAGVVALPLALAFGEASGAGPIAGLYGAIITGFFASLFGGTGAQVTGPTGPMVVVFAGLFASMSGSLELIFASVVLAGLIQIGFSFMKLGQYIKLVPYPVISGFMSGIGVIIILLQLSRLFGHAPDGGGTISALEAIPGAIADPNTYAFGLGALTLAMVFFWPKALSKFIPGALGALIIGTLLSLYLPTAVPILGDIPTGLPEFVIPKFSEDTLLIVVEAAFVLAILGAIDSLLTSLVADNVTRTRHDSNKELFGQGVGNAIAGLFGAIPGAGATMRTMVNIKSGGKTKISGMTHGLLLLSVVLALGPYAAHIPHAVLAGILVKVGYDIIDFQYLKRAHKGPRWDLILMILVLGLTVFADLITAVIVGVVLAALAFVKQMADEQMKDFEATKPQILNAAEKKILDAAQGKITYFNLSGPLSFGAAADLAHRARAKSKGDTSAIILDFVGVPHVDVSAAKAIESVISDAQYSGLDVYTVGMNKKVADTLKGLSGSALFKDKNNFDNRTKALEAAEKSLSPKKAPAKKKKAKAKVKPKKKK